MRAKLYAGISVILLWIMVCVVTMSFGDVVPGEVIDKENWRKAEGLLPEPILGWVKKGEYVFKVGSLHYDLSKTYPTYLLENREGNAEKYDLNEKDEMIDVQTGKLADDIVGIPFPRINPKDPKAATKIIYNAQLMRLQQGSGRWPGMLAHSLNRSRLERNVEIHMQYASFLGWPGAKDVPNPNRYQELVLYRVNSPYDLAGTAVLFWRYLALTPDMTFGYVPAIRRVRRMSPANRSDATFGLDFSADDSGYAGYDGKIPYFSWKLVGEDEMLGMFFQPDAVPCRPNQFGELTTEVSTRLTKYGYETEGWAGAIWAPVNHICVKRPVWIVECHAKDPFYNYGKQILWIDKDMFCGFYKQVFDHSGEHWKVYYQIWGVTETDDKVFRVPVNTGASIIDDRAGHASVIETLNPRCPANYFTKDSIDVYSLAGFQRFCK